MNTATIDLFLLVLVLVLGFGAPLMGVYEFRRLRAWLAAGRPDARLATYRWIMIWEWGFVAVFLGWWLGMGRDLGQAGMGFGPTGWQWLAVGLGLLAAALLVVQAVVVLRDRSRLTAVRGKARGLEPLIPLTAAERGAFGFLSLTAGICEEVLYRGFLLSTLAAVVGPWPAVALSSAVFGLGHVYQGRTGILKTGLVGLAMALLTVFGGTIWVAALVHAVLDATSGRILSAALAGPGPAEDTGPDVEPDPEPVS